MMMKKKLKKIMKKKLENIMMLHDVTSLAEERFLPYRIQESDGPHWAKAVAQRINGRNGKQGGHLCPKVT
jgi:hypothetical protein